jgi:hypothetical protein
LRLAGGQKGGLAHRPIVASRQTRFGQRVAPGDAVRIGQVIGMHGQVGQAQERAKPPVLPVIAGRR